MSDADVVLPRHYDFGRFTTVADIGGGDGTLLSAILHHHPDIDGIVFDSPTGITDAARTLEAAELGERCTIESGNLLERVPHGAEVYVLNNVLHHWADDDAATILRRCREQLPPHGQVLIIEPVLGNEVRTRVEFEALCARAGLRLVGVTALPGLDFAVLRAETLR